MPYPEFFVAPMRKELTDLGFQELRTTADVDDGRRRHDGHADDRRELGVRLRGRKSAAGHCPCAEPRPSPDTLATVFAGADVAATDRARGYFTGYAPSSPSIALLRDGKLVYMLERSQIENRDALAIASELSAAFNQFCATPTNA